MQDLCQRVHDRLCFRLQNDLIQIETCELHKFVAQ